MFEYLLEWKSLERLNIRQNIQSSWKTFGIWARKWNWGIGPAKRRLIDPLSGRGLFSVLWTRQDLEGHSCLSGFAQINWIALGFPLNQIGPSKHTRSRVKQIQKQKESRETLSDLLNQYKCLECSNLITVLLNIKCWEKEWKQSSNWTWKTPNFNIAIFIYIQMARQLRLLLWTQT